MTALIFDRRDTQRLLICSDTLGYSVGEGAPKPLGFAAKVIPFPHLRGVLCSRGMLQIGINAAAHLMLDSGLVTHADVVTALPPILRTVTQEYADTQGIDDPDALMMYEAIWAGWDDATQRCQIVALRNFEDYEPVPDTSAPGVSALPVLTSEYIPKGLAQVPPEQMLVELMKSMRRFLADHPEVIRAIVGGEIEISEVTASGVNSRIVHQFEDFEATKHAAAAVRARIARGDDEIDVGAGLCRAEDALDPDELVAASAAAPVPGAARAERRRQQKAAKRRRA